LFLCREPKLIPAFAIGAHWKSSLINVATEKQVYEFVPLRIFVDKVGEQSKKLDCDELLSVKK